MRRLSDWLLSGVLVALTLLAYLPVCDNDFVSLDDEIYITKNSAVLRGWTGMTWRWAWRTYYGSYWQPLSWVSLQGDVQLFGTRLPGGLARPSAVASHVHNVLWHAASGVLLFWVLRQMTGTRWRSFFVAGLFALHPLRVESVAWAAERKDVLSCFFGVLTLWAYIRYAGEPGWRRYLGVCGAFLVSLLCKPMLMTLPFALLLLDYWPLGRLPFAPARPAADGGPALAPVSLGRLLGEKVPLFALTAAIMYITVRARQQTDPGVSYAIIPLFDRLAIAAAGYGWYLVHTVWPVGLGVMYPHPGRDWSVSAALAGTATVLVLTVLCCWQAGRRPWLIVGWLWFVGSLVPVMGWAQNGEQAWADRFTYWPHVGLLIALVWSVAEVIAYLRVPAAVVGTTGALVLGVLAALTAVQVTYWHDTQTLWEHTLEVTQDNNVAHEMLGRYYQETGRLELARDQFAEAVRVRPDNPIYQYLLGNVLYELHQDEAAEAHLRTAVRLDPNFFPARERLVQVRSRREAPRTPTN